MMNLGQQLDRPIMMDISKDGTVTFRSRHAVSFLGAIPVFSVDTEQEARRLLTYLCTEQNRDHPGVPGMRWYVFDEFTGDPADLADVVEVFADAYDRLRPKAVAA